MPWRFSVAWAVMACIVGAVVLGVLSLRHLRSTVSYNCHYRFPGPCRTSGVHVGWDWALRAGIVLGAATAVGFGAARLKRR